MFILLYTNITLINLLKKLKIHIDFDILFSKVQSRLLIMSY